jgi:hypothetical protein
MPCHSYPQVFYSCYTSGFEARCQYGLDLRSITVLSVMEEWILNVSQSLCSIALYAGALGACSFAVLALSIFFGGYAV